MKMTLFFKIAAIVFIIVLFMILVLRLIIKKLLSDHRFFAIVSKKFYNYFYSIRKIQHLRANNFGYAPIDEDIAVYDPDHQYGIQLYKELVKNHNGFLINENSSVAEVGCGKGAGAEYLIKKLEPKKYTGIDYSEKAIDFCANTYRHIKNAEFVCADALELPFSDNSFDVVLNVESSHLYKDLKKFFAEVHRILKPNGKFLFTDFRYVKNYSIDALEEQIAESGFSATEKRIITPMVLNSCRLASDRREKLVQEVIPRYLQRYFRHYAIINGTKKFIMLGNGEIIYFMYHLEKNKPGQYKNVDKVPRMLKMI